MHDTTRLWLGLGASLLLTASPVALSDVGPRLLTAGAQTTDAPGGEGGGEGGVSAPSSYAIAGTVPDDAYDAAPQVEGYAALVHASYVAAHAAALSMQAAIAAFLADPDADTLARARFAWMNARIPYLQTEAFRFYDGPIDFSDPAHGEQGPEGEINAWPLNEAFIDYVEGDPDAGLINDRSVTIMVESIRHHDQVTDESDVTTGWHAIEFLLWGQDLSATGPGDRPAAAYLPGQGNNDRRRTYLDAVTKLLVLDLARLVTAWAPDRDDNYAARFKALPQREALGRMLNGMAILAGSELMSERLAVGLDSGDQEDEHSCFSDTTRNDFIYDIRGIRNVWYGDTAEVDVAGLDELVAKVDPLLGFRIAGLLNRAEALAAAIPQPFDQVLAAPADSPGRMTAERLVTALQDLGDGLREVGTKLGVLVQVPNG
jgi:putative iron-regulated protein